MKNGKSDNCGSDGGLNDVLGGLFVHKYDNGTGRSKTRIVSLNSLG